MNRSRGSVAHIMNKQISVPASMKRSANVDVNALEALLKAPNIELATGAIKAGLFNALSVSAVGGGGGVG